MPSSSSDKTSIAATGRTRAFAVLLLLTGLNILSFADRFLLQAFAVDIVADLRLSNLQFTLLTGFVFTLFYTLMGLLMGLLADRCHRPRLMAAGLALWSALTALTGAARNALQITLARMFVGVGEATLTPSALGLLGDVFPRRHRAFAAGCYYLGAPVGIGGAFILAGTAGAAAGWRHCFLALGAIGLGLTLLLLLLREPRTVRPRAASAAPWGLRGQVAELFGRLRASPALCLVFLGGLLVIFAQGALVLDQLWLVQERGFSKTAAQKLAGGVFLLGGIAGALGGGLLSDLMQARRRGGRLYGLVLIYAVGTPLSLYYRFADPHGALFYVCMLIGSATVTAGYGPLFASVQDLVPDRVRSSMIGLFALALSLFGTSAGNLLVGWLADFLRSAQLREPLTWAALIGLMPGLLAIPCFHLAARWAEHSAD